MATCGFVVTESERITTSSRLVDGALICRPTATLRWPNVAIVGFAVIASVALVGSLDDQSGTAAGIAVGLVVLVILGGSIAWAAGMMRSELRADESGLLIRDRWRIRKFTWQEIESFDVVEQPPPLRWMPNVSVGFTWHVWPKEAVPILRLRLGIERKLFPLTSSTRSEGWSLGDVSPAETRAALLTRYQGAISSALGSPWSEAP